jgi:hypothetical protein
LEELCVPGHHRRIKFRRNLPEHFCNAIFRS